MLRVLIVEDDPLASALLSGLLRRRDDVAVLAVVAEFDEARKRVAQADYDLVFLDIQLHHHDGFDLVPHVVRSARIIFVTGYAQHALRAFAVNALDYIVKPITAVRLAAALERVHEAYPTAADPRRLRRTDRIFLRGASATGMFTELEAIALVRSSENYSEVVMASGDQTIVRRTMQAWEDVLPVDPFVRVHRTAIINLGWVERVEHKAGDARKLWLRGVAKPVAVSRRLWGDLRTRLAAASLRPIQRH